MYLGKHFFLVFFIERQDFIDILFHAFSSDEHEVKYDDQYTDIDRKLLIPPIRNCPMEGRMEATEEMFFWSNRS